MAELIKEELAELIKEELAKLDNRNDDELKREADEVMAFDILKDIECIEITSGESRGCNPNVLYLTLCWDDGSSLWTPIRRGDTSLGNQILNILISAYAVRIAHGKYL